MSHSAQKEDLFKQLVLSVRDYAIFALDPSGQIISWNEGAKRLKGYNESEVIGKHFSIFYPEQDNLKEKLAKELEIATHTGYYEEEGWRVRKDGSQFWAHVVITVMRNEAGDLIGFGKVTRDLTERRAAVNAGDHAAIELRKSEDVFESMVSAVKDYAIFMLDPQGHVMTWNAGAERIKGYSAEEAIGKHFSMFYTADAKNKNHPQYELEIAQKEGSYEEEGWRIRKDGSQFWASVVITAVHNKTGQLIGFAKVTRDLTERSVAERTNETFSLLVSSVKDYAIFMLDPHGNIMTWNEGAHRIKGYSAQDIIGKHFSIFYTAEARERKHPDYELEVAKKQGSYEEEGWRVRKDGSEFWANVVITAVHDKQGKLLGFAKVTRDLTERKQTELELERARDEAIMAANRLKSQFVANISHEIRTPLSGVVGLSEILARTTGMNEESRDSAIRVFEASKQLLVILNDLLDFAKLEAGRVEIENVAYDLRAVIDDVIGLSQPKADEKHLALSVQLPDDLPHELIGDPGKVRQILLNLVHNALKFTEDGGVELAAERKGDELRFSVTDTGIGISKDAQKKLFQPFTQAAGSTTRRFGGTGLGLSIAQQYAQLMGGTIGVASEESLGSTFWFTLPLKADQDE